MINDFQKFLNDSVINRVKARVAQKAGDLFGLELECEGESVDYNAEAHVLYLGNGWLAHKDGSLRHTHGQACEWVFASPANYTTSIQRVNKLFDYFEGRKAKLVCSNRTSFHVHYNMSDKNVYQVVNTFILFTILEDILDRYCGEDRNGNLFCLSSRHAEGQLGMITQAIFESHNFKEVDEGYRYCSLNMASLNKFGTVEFRGMRGLDNKGDVLRWLSIINDLCTYACYTMHNPVDIVEGISLKSPDGLLREIFSKDNYTALTRGLNPLELSNSVYEGIRLVQMMCYQIGAEFDAIVVKGKDFWQTLKPDAVIDDDNLPPPIPEPFFRDRDVADRGINPFRELRIAPLRREDRLVPHNDPAEF